MINVKVRKGLLISWQEQDAGKGGAQDRQAWTMLGRERTDNSDFIQEAFCLSTDWNDSCENNNHNCME